MTTTPFHDPYAEPVRPIRTELDGRALDPFAELQIDEVHEITARPGQREALRELARASRSSGAHDRLARLARQALEHEPHRLEEVR